jgi:DNA-directed RNA polymerase specialized sigma24 family protein
MAKLWERALERYDPAMPFGPWFLQVVKNTARNLGRSERRRLNHLEQCALSFPGEHDGAEHAGLERHEAEEEARAGRAVEEQWPWWALA